MQSTVLLFLAALGACACAGVYRRPHYTDKDDDLYENVAYYNWQTNLGKGQVFGTLGSTDESLFGKAGYKQDFFNDQRGHLQGQAYGTRVLGADGGSSVLGSKLEWANSNDNARAAIDVHKEIGGGSGVTLTGDGVWKVDKDTRFVAGGIVDQNFGHGKPTVGLEAKVEHDF